MKRILGWVVAAVLAAAAVPTVYFGAATYGAEILVWDAVHSTYTYVERPGGFAVLTGGMLLCALLVLAAVGAAVMAVLSAAQLRPGRHLAAAVL